MSERYYKQVAEHIKHHKRFKKGEIVVVVQHIQLWEFLQFCSLNIDSGQMCHYAQTLLIQEAGPPEKQL